MQKNLNETNKNIEEKSFFHLFKIDINELWNYFIEPSFIPTYFHENCKLLNNKNLKRPLKENDIAEIFYPEFEVKMKLIIEKIIEEQNFKSFSLRLIDHPDDICPFVVTNSFYFCSHTHVTALKIKIIILDNTKSNFILDYFYKNEGMIYKCIEKYSEINFKESEETESIAIRKNYSEVFDFITKKNYANLKILLGNNASIRPTNNPNEIEVEHFTKNNKVKFNISNSKEFNEKQLIIQPLESEIQIPRQIIIIKIININKDDCLVMFIHKLKEYVTNDIINNYSILKKKLLWLLKSTIEGSS